MATARRRFASAQAGSAQAYLDARQFRVRISLYLAHETAGAACTRHSLYPPISRVNRQPSDAMRRGNADLCSA